MIRINLTQQNRVEWIFVAQHSEGEWLRLHQMEKLTVHVDDDHVFEKPVLYVGLHSHCMYHTPGIKWRLFGLANDKCARGELWTPKAIIHHPFELNPSQLWTHFTGRVYEGGQVLPNFRGSYLNGLSEGLRTRYSVDLVVDAVCKRRAMCIGLAVLFASLALGALLSYAIADAVCGDDDDCIGSHIAVWCIATVFAPIAWLGIRVANANLVR